ncbi:MAG: hypothetical protein AB1791_02115 [Chloroflexota bacterium]
MPKNWLVYNIPPTTSGWPEGVAAEPTLPDGSLQGHGWLNRLFREGGVGEEVGNGRLGGVGVVTVVGSAGGRLVFPKTEMLPLLGPYFRSLHFAL